MLLLGVAGRGTFKLQLDTHAARGGLREQFCSRTLKSPTAMLRGVQPAQFGKQRNDPLLAELLAGDVKPIPFRATTPAGGSKKAKRDKTK